MCEGNEMQARVVYPDLRFLLEACNASIEGKGSAPYSLSSLASPRMEGILQLLSRETLHQSPRHCAK